MESSSETLAIGTTLAPWALHCRAEKSCSDVQHDECDCSFVMMEFPLNMHLPHATFSLAQSLHSTDDMYAWLKGLKGLRRIVCQKTCTHPRVLFHLAPHSTLNTSTSSLSLTSPVLLSSSSPNRDLLSTHPLIHNEDPRQDGTSTEFHSSTVITLVLLMNCIILSNQGLISGGKMRKEEDKRSSSQPWIL